jgi:hypothetical protein
MAAAGLVLAALLAWYVVRLDRRVVERLGGGAGHAHTRFFAAPFRIVPGMDLQRAGILDRLAAADYRNDQALGAPGTWRRRSGVLEIRLRAFDDVVDGPLPERRARLELAGNVVRAIVDVPTGTRRAQATVEPAPLDVAWSGVRCVLRRCRGTSRRPSSPPRTCASTTTTASISAASRARSG